VRRLLSTALAGLVGGAAAALLETVARYPFGVPLPAELFADRILPTIPIGTFLNLLGKAGGPIAAKEQAFWGGIVGVVAAAVVAALAWELLLRRRSSGTRAAIALVFLLGVATAGALLPVLDSNYAGLPPLPAGIAAVAGLAGALAVATLAIGFLQPPPERADSGRRDLFKAGAGLVLLAATGGLAARLFRDGTFGYDGMRLLTRDRQPLTPAADFYTVTKNLVDPDVDPALWRLEVTGAVAEPFTLTLDELRAVPSQTQETTLECISNGVGYGLLSNAAWTGPSLQALLARARPAGGARRVELQGVDGYVYSLPVDRALRGDVVVAHAMNGEPLDRRHGAPARAVVAGAYGEASAKWLTRVTVIETDEPGYYESQGWRAGYVHTTSVIDRPAGGSVLPAGNPVTIKGAAFAGDRGVSRVELSPDGGQTWLPATIVYSGSPQAWVLWSLTWTPRQTGDAVLTVRAYDGAGTVQEATRHGFVPAGSTGLHSVRVQVV
jgi:DMSO/TMAO reductase YedYZ molybdopterin-dependent catalytic subunit